MRFSEEGGKATRRTIYPPSSFFPSWQVMGDYNERNAHMKKLSIIATVALIGSLIIGGCKSDEDSAPAAKSTNTYAVVVGMENSRFAGACPGAGYDADRMYELLKQCSVSAILLRDSNATKANVVKALDKAINQAGDGLVIFFYSGHGGSQPLPNTGAEEVDGMDEFYCLWDTWFLDNEMWNLIAKCKGRIMLINDCCHSETIFRESKISLTRSIPLSAVSRRDGSFSMLCWSGCPDNTYSYGASTGGQFTNALLRHFDARKTYEFLWNEIKNDKVLRNYEDPQSTCIGSGFYGKPIFR